MSERLRRDPFWPLGYRVYAVVALLMLAATAVGLRGMFSWPYQEWQQTSALFHQRLDLAGPVAAFCGAYVSGRLTPPSRVFALPRFQRDVRGYLVRTILPLAVTVTVAFVVALLPLVFVSVTKADSGALDLAVVLSGVLGLQVYLVLGWLFGLVARTAFVAPVAFALGMVATIAGYSGDTYAAVAPVLHMSPYLGTHESTPMLIFRIAFFVAVITIALLTAASVLAHRQFSRGRPTIGTSALWVVVAALFVVGVARTPALFAPDAELPRTCQEVAGVEVCVHKGHSAELVPLAALLEPVFRRAGATNLPFDRVYDRALAGPLRLQDPRIYYYDLGPTLDVGSGIQSLAYSIAGLDQCMRRYGVEGANPQITNMRLLAERLADGHGRYGQSAFTTMSDEQLATWMTEHRKAVQACALDTIQPS